MKIGFSQYRLHICIAAGIAGCNAEHHRPAGATRRTSYARRRGLWIPKPFTIYPRDGLLEVRMILTASSEGRGSHTMARRDLGYQP